MFYTIQYTYTFSLEEYQRQTNKTEQLYFINHTILKDAIWFHNVGHMTINMAINRWNLHS